jgi:hypothetical protein
MGIRFQYLGSNALGRRFPQASRQSYILHSAMSRSPGQSSCGVQGVLFRLTERGWARFSLEQTQTLEEKAIPGDYDAKS